MPLETDVKNAEVDEYFPDFSESSSNSDAIAFKVAAIPADIADNPFDVLDMEAVTVDQKPKHSPFAMLAAAGMVSLAAVVLAGGYYLLSRPCVIGECTALANAKQLSENSAKTLKTSKVASSPEEAQGQLKQAIDQFMQAWNHNPKPLIWTATVSDIIAKIERARLKMEHIKPGSTLPRGKKTATNV